jgi:hypothetical protein
MDSPISLHGSAGVAFALACFEYPYPYLPIIIKAVLLSLSLQSKVHFTGKLVVCLYQIDG